jgi:hypothetical protein
MASILLMEWRARVLGTRFVISPPAFHVQTGIGYSPLHTALSMIPFTLGVGAGSGLAPQLMVLGRRLVMAGSLTMAAGMAVVLGTLDRYGSGLHSWQLIPGLVISGFGMAMVAGTLVNIVLAKVPRRHSGQASSLVNTTIQVGVAVGGADRHRLLRAAGSRPRASALRGGRDVGGRRPVRAVGRRRIRTAGRPIEHVGRRSGRGRRPGGRRRHGGPGPAAVTARYASSAVLLCIFGFAAFSFEVLSVLLWRSPLALLGAAIERLRGAVALGADLAFADARQARAGTRQGR